MTTERIQFIHTYADHVKKSNNNKKELNAFINAQVHMANAFYARLIHSKNGKEKFRKITGATHKFTESFYQNTK